MFTPDTPTRRHLIPLELKVLSVATIVGVCSLAYVSWSISVGFDPERTQQPAAAGNLGLGLVLSAASFLVIVEALITFLAGDRRRSG